MCRPGIFVVLYTMVAVLLLGMVISGASAVSITITPDRISPGNDIQVIIYGLENGSTFSLTIQGSYEIENDSSLDFQAKNFTMPFTLSGGEIEVATTNTAWVLFSVSKGTTELSMEASPRNGTFSTAEAQSVPAGVYNYLRLQALPFAEGLPVSTSMQLSGVKSGPRDSTIHFTIEGVDNATVLVGVAVDGEDVVSNQIVIGNGQGNATPALPAAHLAGLLAFLCILYGVSRTYREKP